MTWGFVGENLPAVLPGLALFALLGFYATRHFRKCMCGHQSAAHKHYRAGTDCGLCDCPQLRQFSLFKRGAAEPMQSEIYAFIGAQKLSGPKAVEFVDNGSADRQLLIVCWSADQVYRWAPVFGITKTRTVTDHDLRRTEAICGDWRGYKVTVYFSRWINPAYAHYAQVAAASKGDSQ